MSRLLFRRATHDPITGEYVFPKEKKIYLEDTNWGIIHMMDNSKFMSFDEIAEATIGYNSCYPDGPYDLLSDLIIPLGELIKIGAVEMRVE